ncbi:MAG: hypothetical protein HOP11_12655 [Saprospiraceae bacterium]|nr:hypothetical protein [Saprospiraceae bacterium]
MFDHYSFKEGFPATQSLSVCKSKSGVVWIGSEQGLIKYDGQSFKLYSHDPKDSNSILHNYCSLVKEDKYKRLWISANNRVEVFNPVTEVFTPVDLHNVTPNRIHSFYYDEQKDKMWISTSSGVFIQQGLELDIETRNDSLFKLPFNFLSKDKDGLLWFANNEGLFSFDESTNRVLNFFDPLHFKNTNRKYASISNFIDSNNIIWIGTWGNGLLKYDINKNKFEQFLFSKTKFNLVFSAIQSPIKGEKEILWIATSEGLKGFNTKYGIFDDTINNFFGIKSHIEIPVFGFCPTNTEGLWITSENGLHRYDPNKQIFPYSKIKLPDPFKKSKYAINEILKQSSLNSDTLWLGIPYIGLFRYLVNSNKILDVPSTLKNYAHKDVPIITCYIDSKHVLWISASNFGLCGFDIYNNKFIVQPFSLFKDKENLIWSIEEDFHGNIWMATEKGLFVFNYECSKYEEVVEFNNYLTQNSLNISLHRISIDKDNNIWAINNKDHRKNNSALLHYIPKSKKTGAIRKDSNYALQLLDQPNGLKIINNKLIIFSNNGLAISEADFNRINFKYLSVKDGLVENAIRSACSDNNGNIWLSHQIGISKLDLEKNIISKYNSSFFSNVSLGTSEIIYDSITNTLQFGIFNDYYKIDLGKLAKNDSVRLFVNSIIYGNKNKKSWPLKMDDIELSYSENKLTFELSLNSFTNSNENTFYYILDGVDNNWNKSQSNIISYQALAPGDYVFRAKASNNLGNESVNSVMYYISVKPPYYNTWWFQILIVVFVLFLAYLFFKYRELQKVKVEQLRYNISRDLHDEIGSNLSNIKMLSELEVLKNSNNSIKIFDIIVEKTNQVMQSMSEIVWSINPNNDVLSVVILKIQEFAIDVLEPKDIELKFDIKQSNSLKSISLENRRHFYLIFKELINNAAKYSCATMVELKIHVLKNTVHAEFKDNGIGFDAYGSYSGNGLKNLKSRVKEMKGTISISSSSLGSKTEINFPV